MLKFALLLGCLTACLAATSQDLPVYEKLMQEMKSFRLDTSAVPEDALTKKIRELRSLRGVFHISEAIQFKLQEEKSKGEMAPAQVAMLETSFQSGAGRRWLDNAMTWIFRRHFTLKEIKSMIRFYKSGAGQKLATAFPLVMLESMAAAQAIHEMLVADFKK